MFLTLDDGKPSEQMLSAVYNFDSGICEETDRMMRRKLNASVKHAAYTFDRSTKTLLRKRLC